MVTSVVRRSWAAVVVITQQGSHHRGTHDERHDGLRAVRRVRSGTVTRAVIGIGAG